jgi:hypothetical protein
MHLHRRLLIKKDHFFATCDLLGVCLQLNEHLLLFSDDGMMSAYVAACQQLISAVPVLYSLITLSLLRTR